MTLARYRVFLAIVAEGNLTRAAETLHCTQSAVSHALASLEGEVGFPLLLRERGGVRLTDAGERLLPHLRTLLRDSERLEQEVAALHGLEAGTVRIGTFTSVSSRWLPGVLYVFQEAHPLLEIQLREGDYQEIEGWIADGSVDFGFVSLPTSRELEVRQLLQERVFCILPWGHPLGGERRLSLRQLHGLPFIMPKWGEEMRRLLAAHQVAPCIKYEVTEDQAIIAMVEHGLGVSLLPEMVLPPGGSRFHRVPLQEEHCRTIGIAALSWQRLAPAAARFVTALEAWLQARRLPARTAGEG